MFLCGDAGKKYIFRSRVASIPLYYEIKISVNLVHLKILDSQLRSRGIYPDNKMPRSRSGYEWQPTSRSLTYKLLHL